MHKDGTCFLCVFLGDSFYIREKEYSNTLDSKLCKTSLTAVTNLSLQMRNDI